ncbi:hypothetical protein Hanom_Chr16g01458331 [Helianthus anomalus]
MTLYTSAESDDLKQCFIKQVEDQVYADRATLQELKRCFDGLQTLVYSQETRFLQKPDSF